MMFQPRQSDSPQALPSNKSSPTLMNNLPTNLPGDVWRDIFKICLVDSEEGDLDDLYDCRTDWGTQPPLLLCWICSHWRSIAINAPELWRVIPLGINSVGKPSPLLGIMNLFLQRAGTTPLKISLRRNGTYNTVPKSLSTAAWDAIQLLFQNLHRAKNIDLDTVLLSKLLDESPLEQILPRGAPLLETFEFRSGGFNSATDPRLVEIWTHSPYLRSVVFHESSIQFDYSYVSDTLHIPFPQLTCVEVAPRISVLDLYNLLSESKNLAKGIFGHLSASSMERGLKPLSLPVLKHLSITADWGIVSFFSCVRAPALNTLKLHDSGEDWPQGAFRSFLRNSSSSIQHLGITVIASNSKEKMICLGLLSQLISLTVYSGKQWCWRNTDNFNENLVYELEKWDEEQKIFALLPRLQELTVDYKVIHDPGNSTAFADMVEHRWIKVRVVKVDEESAPGDPRGHKWAPNEILRLLFLKANGLDVELDPAPQELERCVFYPPLNRRLI